MEKPPLLTDIPKMAKLARIEFTEAETAEVESKIGKILEYMTILNSADISGVSPAAQVGGLHNRMRMDSAYESGLREKLLAQSPFVVEDVLVKVPAVLPGEGMA